MQAKVRECSMAEPVLSTRRQKLSAACSGSGFCQDNLLLSL